MKSQHWLIWVSEAILKGGVVGDRLHTKDNDLYERRGLQESRVIAGICNGY